MRTVRPEGVAHDATFVESMLGSDVEGKEVAGLLPSLGQTVGEWGDVIGGIPTKVRASAASTIAGMQAAELEKLRQASLAGVELTSPQARTETPEETAARLGDSILEQLAVSREASADLQPTPGATIGQRGLEQAAISGVPSAVAIGAGLLTRNPAIAAGAMYPTAVGSSFAGTANTMLDQEAQRAAETLTPEQLPDFARALKFAQNEGLIETATEVAPFGRLLKVGTPGVRRLAEVLLAELPGETLATLMQSINQQLALQPQGEAPLDAVFAGLEEGGKQIPETLVATILGSAAQSAPFVAAELAANRQPEAPPVDQMVGPLPPVQSAPAALPAPVLEVTPGGVAARPGELERAQREAVSTAETMGLTPDVLANIERLEGRQAEAAAQPLPALPAPDTTLYVDDAGNAQTLGAVEEYLRAIDDAIVAAQGEREALGLTPDVEANLARLEARKTAQAPLEAIEAPDGTFYVDEAGRAATPGQRIDYEVQGNQEARAAADAAEAMGFTADVAAAGAQREVSPAHASDQAAAPAPPPGFVRPEAITQESGVDFPVSETDVTSATNVGDQIAGAVGRAPHATAGQVTGPVGRPGSAASVQSPTEIGTQPAADQSVASGQSPTDRLQDPNVRTALEAMKDQTGNVQTGGKLVREAGDAGESDGLIGAGGGTGNVVTKTPWAPRAEWWSGRPHAMTEKQVRSAIDKALAGKPLNPRQQDLIDYLTKFITGERRERQTRSGERRAPPPRGTPDRRIGDRRGRVGEMSREELQRELLTSRVARLPNKRAYDEAPRQPVQAALDVDSLKWINDNMGHDSGDAILGAVGQAIGEATEHGYHFSGDEFVIEGATADEIREVMEEVGERLAKATIEITKSDGTVVTLEGVGVSYGTGETLSEADENLGREKQAREAQGVRAPRGEQPAGASVRRGNQEGRSDLEGDTAAAPGEDVSLTEDQGDLFGKNKTAQSISDRQREKDDKRSPNRDVDADTGAPGDLFSRSQQRDITDDPDVHLTTVRTSDLEASIEKLQARQKRLKPGTAEREEIDETLAPLLREMERRAGERDATPPKRGVTRGSHVTLEGDTSTTLPALGEDIELAEPDRRRSPRDWERPEAAETATVSDMKAAVRALFAGAKNAPTVEFVAGSRYIPNEIRERMFESAGKRWGGLFDPMTGRVMINTQTVTTTEGAQWVAAHEVDGHLGLRGFIGDRPRLDKALAIAAQNPTIEKLAQAIKRDRTRLTNLQSVEEALAELQGARAANAWDRIGAKYGVEISKAMQRKASSAIDRFLERLKQLIARIRGVKFTDEQVRELLEGARRYVREGTTAASTPKRDKGDEDVKLATAHHGSPHEFKEFKLEAVGSGEGAAAYGWGLYFAENPAVATDYRNRLSGASDKAQYTVKGKKLPEGPERHAAGLMAFNDAREIRATTKRWLTEYATSDGMQDTAKKAGMPAKEYWERLNTFAQTHTRRDIKVSRGYVYTVDVADDAIETMLDWDAPVGSQPRILKLVNEALGLNDVTVDYWTAQILDEYTGLSYSNDYIEGLIEEYVQFSGYGDRGSRVEDELREIAPEAAEQFFMVVERDGLGGIDANNDTGATLYKALQGASGDDKAASMKLLELGVRGIKYYDAGSRNAGDGTRNYVVFDANDVRIRKVNGEPVSRDQSDKIVANTAEGMEEDVKLSETDDVAQTETPEFKKWFGDSQIVDDAGQPLRVYHGTAAKVEAFDKETIKAEAGFFFVDEPLIASDFAEATGRSRSLYRRPNVMPVYLKIENPLYVDGAEVERDLDYSRAIRRAKSGKHDGLVVQDVRDVPYYDPLAPTSTVYVIFEPNQVKSAIGNRGTFDPNEEDIALSESRTNERRSAQRRSKARKPAGRRSTDTARSAKGDRGYKAIAQRAIDTFNDKLGWRWGALGKLPGMRAYLKERYESLGRIGRSQSIARAVYNAFKKATPAEARQIYDYLTNRGALASTISNEKLRNDAIQTKNLIDDVGKRLVDEGMLSQDAYDEHAGEYLPRVYLKHLLGDRAVRAIGAGKTTSDMGYLKQRLSEEQLPKEVRDVILGEITDPAFLASFSLGRTLRDLALIDFFKAIAGDKRWVPEGATVEWNGRSVSPWWLDAEAKQLRRRAQHYEPDTAKKARAIADKMEAAAATATTALGEKDLSSYRQIPDSRRYGVLRGLWVRREIYNDLVGQQAAPGRDGVAERVLGENGLLTGLTRAFKISKIVLNPPAQIRNFMSNLMLLHLSGVPARLIPKRVGQAIRSLARRDRYFDLYEKFGGTAATWQAAEVKEISQEWIRLKELEKNPLSRMMSLGAAVVNKASNAYGLLESIGKLAKIIDAIEREGMSPADAMLAAHEALFDYSLVHPNVRYLRNNPLGAPFITFQYKVLPQLARTAVKHPLRFAPYAAVPYLLLELLMREYDVDDDDVEKLKNAFPSWMRERGQMLLLPWKDNEGRWQVADMGYLTPWGLPADLYATAKEDPGKAAKNALQQVVLGGPLTDVAAAIETNVDPFTGREIVNPSDPPADKLRAMMLYAWNLAMPGFITERGAIPQTIRAAQGNVNNRGEKGQTATQAALRMFGINVYPVDPEATRAANLRSLNYQHEEMEARARELLRNQNLSDAERTEIRATWRKLLEDDARAIRDYAASSEIHPNLRSE